MTEEQLEKMNDRWDKQIEKDEKFQVHKDLFNLTLNFNINDWRKIRTKKYWSKSDSLDYDLQKEYTLQCVEYYINNLTK